MAQLLSVNVGLPQDIEWQGKTVHTAIWKTPVQGRRVARRLNIDGDGQGDLVGHGGEHRAVFVFRSTPIAIGKASSAEAISAMGSSGRISRSTGCSMARCVSGIAIVSGVPSLK
jgi:MOSC domain-containing protein YiiM